MAALEGHGHLARTLPIVNIDRSVGARLAGELAARHGNTGFRGQLDLTFEGAAGQSFGAFVLQGMNVRLVGEANDYVGKGINGGRITVVPPAGGHDPGSQVILGNTCLYGATVASCSPWAAPESASPCATAVPAPWWRGPATTAANT